MQVGVIGLGYVGLVTSVCLAEWGHDVVGVETNQNRLDALKQGRVPFFEPGLAEMVARHTAAGHLKFSASARRAVRDSDVIIVAVGTHDGNGGWQTETMLACLSEVVPYMADGATLVVRSTLPPDFIRQLPRLLRSLRQQAGLGPIAALLNPEFTREGAALHDFLMAERVIFGVIDDADGHGQRRLAELYARSTAPILTMSAIDAAFAKLGSNLFLATKISFANELAALCDAYGAQVDQVVAGMAYDARIGGSFLRAGVGFGGSCLPNQVAMTVKSATLAGVPAPLLAAVDEINHRQRLDFVSRIRSVLGGSLIGARVGLLGLTFKPNTDDLRDAPALDIARHLIAGGAEVTAYDPMPLARERAAELVPGLKVVTTAMDALTGSDAIGLVTEWNEFVELDWAAARQTVRNPVVVDGRAALSPDALADAGFEYIAFGRGVKHSGRADVAIPIETTPGQPPIAALESAALEAARSLPAE
ncbi:MAG TPA: UDP-glucose/GDP-mannose dehydrogenase family protein [Candidatus Limnocylindria bacterium]|nr:UDP-glucose/GDP-mannose dehydrogenase family protein [Candidatus Limnocylindria bacterium]